jgi:hypothetical protein
MPNLTRLEMITEWLLSRLSDDEREGRAPPGFMFDPPPLGGIESATYEAMGRDERPDFVKEGEKGWRR